MKNYFQKLAEKNAGKNAATSTGEGSKFTPHTFGAELRDWIDENVDGLKVVDSLRTDKKDGHTYFQTMISNPYGEEKRKAFAWIYTHEPEYESKNAASIRASCVPEIVAEGFLAHYNEKHETAFKTFADIVADQHEAWKADNTPKVSATDKKTTDKKATDTKPAGPTLKAKTDTKPATKGAKKSVLSAK